MAGLGIRLYTDEMISPTLAVQLRQRGYDVQSCADAGRSGQRIPDEAQLSYATQNSRAILTFNMRDYLRLDLDWKASGREHAGILVAPEIDDLGLLVRIVQRHLDTYSPSEQHNFLLWVDTSPAS
jgi:Domain of unknown function (DUF5615)